ncbi:MAG TPA: thiamine phosphate synthase [Acidobacteriaceae bacterium]|nr:thiamine phosphate synthase [Acidobacteriaceae bacterium]
MKLPRLYPIVDVGTLTARGVSVEQFVRELLDGGVEILQLRDKQGAPQEVLRRAAAISKLIAGTSCLPVMNDRPDLAVLAGWRAVHLGHKDMPPEGARRVFGESSAAVGVSTHNDAQVTAAQAGAADYVAIGPVFGTSTKADAEPVVGLEGVRRARALTRKPLVAIGGIRRGNAAAVVEAGADSVAVIGGLFADGESVAAVARDFLRILL